MEKEYRIAEILMSNGTTVFMPQVRQKMESLFSGNSWDNLHAAYCTSIDDAKGIIDTDIEKEKRIVKQVSCVYHQYP
jgi:hypothetical protein